MPRYAIKFKAGSCSKYLGSVACERASLVMIENARTFVSREAAWEFVRRRIECLRRYGLPRVLDDYAVVRV